MHRSRYRKQKSHQVCGLKPIRLCQLALLGTQATASGVRGRVSCEASSADSCILQPALPCCNFADFLELNAGNISTFAAKRNKKRRRTGVSFCVDPPPRQGLSHRSAYRKVHGRVRRPVLCHAQDLGRKSVECASVRRCAAPNSNFQTFCFQQSARLQREHRYAHKITNVRGRFLEPLHR